MTSPNDKDRIDLLVSVVMIFRNTESFIGEAIESVLRQTYSNWELLLVDDGSTDGSSAVAAEYAGRRVGQIHLLTHPNHENRGMSASRNAGAAMASGSFIAFLDSDDVWMENALETAVSIFRKHPIVGFTYGCALWWFSWTGDPADQQRDFRDTVASHGDGANKIVFPPQFVTTMMRDGSAVPCLTTVVVRKDLFEDVRGFEDDFPGLFEDQVFYTKLGMNAVGFRTDACWAKYRQHPDSSCSTAEKEGRMQAAGATFESWREAYLSGLGVNVTAIRHDIELPTQAVQAEIRISELEKARIWLERQWRNYKALSEEKDQSIAHLKAWIEELERGKRWLEKENARLQSGAERENVIAPSVSLPSTQEWDDKPVVLPSMLPRIPVSRAWGYDRGTPVDRHYIEKFLGFHQKDISGRVLEVGEPEYTRRFGGDRVTHCDVLHVVAGNPQATVVADLSRAEHLPADTFDCIILTQTLQLIYDLRAAFATLQRILRPGGVLLATAPGITRRSETEWQGSWFWSLTRYSAYRLAEEAFGANNVSVQSFGNIRAAVAFLYGFALEELKPEDLETVDPEYEVIVALRAVKETLHIEHALNASRSPR